MDIKIKYKVASIKFIVKLTSLIPVSYLFFLESIRVTEYDHNEKKQMGKIVR